MPKGVRKAVDVEMREVWQLWKSRSLSPSLVCQVGSCLLMATTHPGNWKERSFDNVRYNSFLVVFCHFQAICSVHHSRSQRCDNVLPMSKSECEDMGLRDPNCRAIAYQRIRHHQEQRKTRCVPEKRQEKWLQIIDCVLLPRFLQEETGNKLGRFKDGYLHDSSNACKHEQKAWETTSFAQLDGRG